MHNTQSAGLSVSIQRAMSARNCTKRGEILSLGLLSSQEDKKFLKELKKIQGEYCGREEIFPVLDNYIQTQVKPEWFKMNAQYDFILSEEAAYQKELASFFIGRKAVANNIQWSVPVNFPIGKTIVTEVFGYAAAVLEDDAEQYTALIIEDGEPKYSPYARLAHKTPENSPELIGAYLGLARIFGRNLKVIIAYTRPKRSADKRLFSEQNNIVTADFSRCSENELKRRLIEALRMRTEEPDCALCKYSAICSGMKIPKTDKAEGNLEVPKTHPLPNFTAEQEKVIQVKDGSCAVYAVPGAGKTTTLVHRLLKLLECGIDPKSILFVTFTNKACDEIRSRIKVLLDTEFDEELPDVFTFNGLGWQILRDNRDIVGDLKLMTAMDEKKLLMDCIEAFPETLKGFSFYKVEGKYGLLSSLLRSFRNLESEEESEREKERLLEDGKDLSQVLAVKQMLQNKIAEEHYIGFDDQITLACSLLEKHPEIRETYGKRWDYIMADEFQDASQENVDLLYAIADAGKRNLVVVGDPDQSIYEWRNGSPEHLLKFEDSYPGCSKIYMQDNFRSARQILEASNHLISKNESRLDIFMVGHKDYNALPYRMRNCCTTGILGILHMLRNKNYEYGDIAILSRNNAPLSKVKLMLDQHGIESLSPFDFFIKDNFFILVKDILDLFFLGFTAATDMSFMRYLMACGVTVPKKTDLRETLYQNCLTYHDMPPIKANDMETMMAYDVEDVDMVDNKLFLAFQKLYRLFDSFLVTSRPEDVLDTILAAFNVDTDMPAVLEFKRLMDYQDFHTSLDFWNYIVYMVELEDDRRIEQEPESNKVNLMTAHGSKGKEFPVVIVLQAEDFGVTEEERRLFYVAMTRAKKCLFILESPFSDCELLHDMQDYLKTVSFT